MTQRIFWALVEGGCATSLLAAGGHSALVAIQTASIVAAFPYTILLLMLCVSIYQGLVQVGASYFNANYWNAAGSAGSTIMCGLLKCGLLVSKASMQLPTVTYTFRISGMKRTTLHPTLSDYWIS